MRFLKNTDKLEPLKRAFGEAAFNQIEFVEADLMSKDALSKAIAGV